MKKYLSLICCLVTGFVVLICALISNSTFSIGENGDDSIIINSYDIVMNVNENNICSVTENISVTFPIYGEKHGIYRFIPYDVDAKFVENEKVVTKKYGANISNIFVNKYYEVYDENGCALIKIGNEYTLVNGETINYIISYDYSIGYDRDENKDFLYYNLIGTEWNTEISNISYSVTLPTSFDAEKVSIFYGKYGSDSTLTPTISNNTISGTIASLGRNEGVTLKIDLPNDYFDVIKINYNWDWLLVVLSVLMLVIVLIIVIKSKGEHIVETVEVLPPSNLTPSDCGFYLNGSVRNKDITSLIIYWANAGYLHIHIKEGLTRLKKLKDMTNAKEYEIILFNKLFANSNDIVVEDNLDIFASESALTIKKIKKECGGSPRINKESIKSFSFALLLTFIPIMALALSYWLKINLPIYAILSIIALLIGFVFTASSMIFTFSDLSRGTKEFLGKFFTFINIIFMAFLIINLFKDRTIDKFGVSIFIAIISIFGIYMSCKLLFFKQNVNQKLGKILGFKNFLINTEKQRMKVLLKDNPNYFYDVLSYAYVMDIEDEYIKKFDSLLITPPEWCESENSLSTFVMFNMLNRNFNAIGKSVLALNMSKNNGSFSGNFGRGGGFSGGGFGGGGGGSW